MLLASTAAMLLVLSAEPAADAQSAEALQRAATAAEKAAAAAERSAEAAAKAAEAASKLLQQGAPGAAAAAAAAAPAKAEEPAKADAKAASWSGTANVGLISLNGNASTFTVSGGGQAQRKTEHWIALVNANGSYGQSRAPAAGGSDVIALNAMLNARGDRRFTDRYSGYLLAGVETDHVKSIEARPFGEAGLSILWLQDTEGDFLKTQLGTDLAFRYGKELRFQYYPFMLNLEDADIVAPKFGVRFRHALNKEVIFSEEAEVLPNVVGESRLFFNSTTKLTARIVSSLGVGVGFVVKHDSRPPPGKVDTDTALTLSLEAAF